MLCYGHLAQMRKRCSDSPDACRCMVYSFEAPRKTTQEIPSSSTVLTDQTRAGLSVYNTRECTGSHDTAGSYCEARPCCKENEQDQLG